ncbi:MAG: apolipoprotein N-acyltransferase [Phycisphaerales bacterium]
MNGIGGFSWLKNDGRQKTEDGEWKSDGLSSVVCPLSFLGSAAMLTVIQAPISWTPLAWVAFVPFIIACSPGAKPRRLFLISYVISLCYWLGNLYWVLPVTIVGWMTTCLYTALLWPVLALCLRYCRAKKVPLFLATGVLIVGVERMQGLFLGGFFWRFLAHSQYQNITLIQIADIFGAGGLSFLIAMVNGLLAELIIAAIACHPERSEGPPLLAITMRFFASLRMTNLLKIALVFAAVVAAVVYGRWRISQEDEFVEAGPLAASLQSNVPQSVKRTFESGDELFDGLMEQSKVAAEAGAELIVWPETMVQATLNPEVLELLESSHPWNVFDSELREHSKDTAFVLVGAYGGTPEIGEDLGIRLGQRFNSAFLYERNGDKAKEIYNKIHLVPFGEVLPLRRSLAWFYELLMKIKFIPYNFDYSLDYGTEYTIFEMSGKEEMSVYKFGVMICYEDTVPAIARRFALDEQGVKRLDWLVNISNDGWFVRFKKDEVLPSTELPQHAAICVFRAVENRLAVLRSVNTGVSCLIDSLGRIRDGAVVGTLPSGAMARTGMAGWFVDRIPIDRRTTFFSKYGEWLDFCCELCVILLIIVLLSVRFFRTRKWRTRLSGTAK